MKVLQYEPNRYLSCLHQGYFIDLELIGQHSRFPYFTVEVSNRIGELVHKSNFGWGVPLERALIESCQRAGIKPPTDKLHITSVNKAPPKLVIRGERGKPCQLS